MSHIVWGLNCQTEISVFPSGFIMKEYHLVLLNFVPYDEVSFDSLQM